ncbi:MAG: hypothetical protein MUF61_01455 [archaeon]|nr:hypothetical protein [archaeon]
MKKGYKILLGASIFLLVVVALLLIMSLLNVWALEKWDVFANVTITDEGGAFELNKGSQDLTFGKLELPGASTRFINFTNSYDFPVVLKMSAEGTIAPLLRLEDVEIESRQAKTISLSVVTTPETELGYYEGRVKFRLLAAK